jgi:hypothetical protein
MNRKIRHMIAVAGFLAGLSQMLATTILAPGSSWYYSTDNGATWSPTTSPAPFGNVTSGSGLDPDFNYATFWAANSPLQVKTTIDLSLFDLSTIRWDLGVDNGFDLYAGNPTATTLVFSANAEGYTFRWEYNNGTFPVGLLTNGPGNEILVVLHDQGYATAFDMQITGLETGAVPDGGFTLLLLAGALGALRLVEAIRRRTA